MKEICKLKNKIYTTIKKILPAISKQQLILLFSILLILLSFTLGYFLSKDESIPSDKEIAIPTTVKITEDSKPTPTITPKPKQWVLEKNTNGIIETITSFCNGCEGINIKQWQDWIFYVNNESTFAYRKIQIIGYNLSIGTSKVIYDLKDYENDFSRGWPEIVSDLKVINNTLFFSLSGYLGGGKTYWIDLPPKNNPKPLTQHGEIKYWRNQYWIINGYGDACWSFTEYSLLNIESKKVNQIATSKTGCQDGEEYVDINRQNRMILAGHIMNTEGEFSDDVIYTYILGIPLSDPSIKEGLISKQDMPPGIKSVIYLEDSNQLLLISNKEKFIYDFNSKIISKTNINTPTSSPTPTPFDNKNFVYNQIKELKLPKNYTFKLK